jgi:hypothetical protein
MLYMSDFIGVWFFRAAALLALLGSVFQDGNAQISDVAPVYYAPDGKIFFRKSVTYQLLTLPFGAQPSGAFPVGANSLAKGFDLEEGIHFLGFKSQDGRGQQVEITVDGTAPVSQLLFTKAPRFDQEKTVWFGKGLSIQFEAKDALSGVLQTVFVLNEAQPAAFTTPIESFTKDGSFEIVYFSVDRVGNKEAERKQAFSVDVSGPVLTYTFKGPRFQNFLGPDAEIVVSAEDAGAGVNRILYRTEKKAFQNYRKPVAADSLKDGKYTLVAYGIDNVNNSGDSLRVPFVVDKTAPSVVSEVEGRQTVRDGVVFIRSASKVKISSVDEASGVAVTRYTIDEKQEIEYRQPFIVSTETGGAVIEFYATDRIGNTSEKKSLRVFVDETAPVTSFDFPAGYFKEGNDLIVNKGGLMVLEAGDLESGVEKVEYRIGKESPWQTFEKPVPWDKIGTFTCEIRATDKLGNVEPIQKLTIRVQEKSMVATGADASARVEKVFKEDQGALIGAGEVPFFLWISDKPDGTGVQLLLAGTGNEVSGKKGKPFTVTQEGVTNIAVSMPGQRTDFPVTLDRTPAKAVMKVNDAPKFNSPDGKLFYSNALEFQLSAADNITGVAGIMVSEDGGRFQMGKLVFRNYTSERQYQVRYFGVDKVGNAEPIQEFTFIIDATPPKTQHKLVKNFAGNSLSPESVLELAATDNLSGVASIKFRFDNQPERVYSSAIKLGDFKDLSDGPHVFYYRATDNVQNREAERQFAFKYDSRKPELELVLEGRTFTRENRIYVAPGAKASFKNPDPKKELRKIWYWRNDTEQTEYSAPVLLDANGPYTFSFSAEDVLGNRTVPVKRTVIPDNRPPSISHAVVGVQVAGSSGETIIGPGTLLQFSANDDDSGVRSISWRPAGQGWRTASGAAKLDIAGKVEIQYQAGDNVGNVAEPKSFSVLNDLTAPEIEITVTPAGRILADGSQQLFTTSVIMIAAKDQLTDVKSISYRINDGPEQPYVRPATAFSTGKMKIVITATDLVGNTKTETRQYVVE